MDIKSVEMQKGIIFGSIVFNIYGKTEHFHEMKKLETSKIACMIRNNIAIAENKIHEATNSIQEKIKTDIISQIERLVSLKDKGVLSKEEFMAMKQKLVNS